jgi:hydrogenase/urease accessory protein HupE
LIKTLLLIMGLAASLTAHAHKASDAYLRMDSATPPQMHFSVALRDADRAIDTLDSNQDRQLTVGEVKAAMPDMVRWVNQGIALRCAGQEQSLSFAFEALEQRSDGAFARLKANLPDSCELPHSELRYNLMQALDADHRVITSFAASSPDSASKQPSSVLVLSPSSNWTALNTSTPSVFKTLASFITLGISHIGSGADHIAFVLCLVLSLKLWRDSKALLTTVTAFTLGHSVTLIAATLGWVGSPSWVEPVIAASIAVAAALNLFSIRAAWAQSLWLRACVAMGFGLIHGLGFSGAMTEAQVPEAALLWALGGFNLGVEIGQLLIIALWSAFYFSIRSWSGYERWIVRTGSICLILIAVYWTFERLGVL